MPAFAQLLNTDEEKPTNAVDSLTTLPTSVTNALNGVTVTPNTTVNLQDLNTPIYREVCIKKRISLLSARELNAAWETLDKAVTLEKTNRVYYGEMMYRRSNDDMGYSQPKRTSIQEINELLLELNKKNNDEKPAATDSIPCEE